MWSAFKSLRVSSQTSLQRCKTRRVQRVFSLRREKKATAGRNLYQKHPDAVIEGIGDAEFDAEGRYLQADFGDLSVISFYSPSGSSSRGAPGRQIPLHGPLPAPHGRPRRQRPPRDRMRRLEHRPPGGRPSRTGNPTRKPGFRPKNATGSTASSTNRAGWIPTAGSIPTPPTPATPGGRTAARLGQERRLAPRLPDRHSNWRPRRPQRWFIKTSASATTHRSRSITTTPTGPEHRAQPKMGFNDSRARRRFERTEASPVVHASTAQLSRLA